MSFEQSDRASSPTSERSCGSCNACCKTHDIDEPTLQKPAARWCPHVRTGKGCSIYQARPHSCQTFICAWLRGFGDEQDRPDRRKVVLDHVTIPGGPRNGILQIFEVTQGALQSPYTTRLTRQEVEHGTAVSHIYLSGRRKIFIPPHEKKANELRTNAEAEGFEIAPLP